MRKVPARPFPGELSVLDSITSLHFRKSAVPSTNESISKIHPETLAMGDELTPDSMLGGDGPDGLGVQALLPGSSAKQYLKGTGVQGMLQPQNILANTGSDALNTQIRGSTIPAWSSNHTPSAPAPPSFDKYSKVSICIAWCIPAAWHFGPIAFDVIFQSRVAFINPWYTDLLDTCLYLLGRNAVVLIDYYSIVV